MIKLELKRLCLGCMTEREDDAPCRLCGYAESGTVDADYLIPGSMLGERYLVGKQKSVNGESVIYIGYDSQEDAKVFIREFMPGKIVTRNHATMHLKPIAGKETIYKNLLAEFEGICSILKNLEHVHGISQIQATITENNTFYAIFRYRTSVTLGDYITQCGGEISWARFKKIYLSLLNTLSQVHKKGLIHAGISPQTIWIDDKENPFFVGFSLNFLRSRNTELEYELFDGYSAPEQYENDGQFGEWTDVYAMSAVLYRCITGTQPPTATDRYISDNLLDAIEMDGNIAQNVSDAIHNGMILSTSNRTQSADGLSAQLLDDGENNTTIYSADSPLNEISGSADQDSFSSEDLDEDPDQEQAGIPRNKSQKTHTLFSMLITMVLTTILLGTFLLIFLQYKYPDMQIITSSSTSSEEVSSTPITENDDTPVVPSFEGQYIDVITTNSDYVSRFDFEPEYQYSDLYANGVVFQQLPEAGTLMPNRGTVILYVSKGRDTVPVPNLVGGTVDLAVQTLTDLELRYEIVEVANDKYLDGVVGMMIPEAGSHVRRTDDSLVITLYTKKAASTDATSSSSKEDSSANESSSKTATRKQDEETSSSSSSRTIRLH